MVTDITLRFDNDDEADMFLRGFEHGHIDGRRMHKLKGEISVVGESQQHPGAVKPPSYHDLYVTTDDIPRTRLFDMPFSSEVICNRVGGWQLWRTGLRTHRVAGEYDSTGLRLDVSGTVIVDSYIKNHKEN